TGVQTCALPILDARALAHYGACYAEQLRPFSPDAGQESLRALYQRRRQLVDMRTQEKNRSQQTLDTLRESTQAVIDCLNRQIEMIETELAERIEADPSWQRKQAL